MEVKELNYIQISLNGFEATTFNFTKEDLIMYRGDTYKIIEIIRIPITDEKIIKLELYRRAIDFYAIVDNKIIQVADYKLSCKKGE